jgi:hypothetical protein
MEEQENKTIKVEISNLTDKQIKAMEYLFAKWQYNGEIGHSEWTAFFADGDGLFQPTIKINDKEIKIQDNNTEENDTFKKRVEIHKIDRYGQKYSVTDFMPMYDEDYIGYK